MFKNLLKYLEYPKDTSKALKTSRNDIVRIECQKRPKVPPEMLHEMLKNMLGAINVANYPEMLESR